MNHFNTCIDELATANTFIGTSYNEFELDNFVGETKATERNRVYAKSIGWDKYYFDISSRFLGVDMFPITELDFTQRVYEWQSKACFKNPDGILGPATWREMALILGVSKLPRARGPIYAVNYPLLRTGLGYCCYKPLSLRYALVETRNALSQIGVQWFNQNGNWPRIRIADISKRGGGVFKPHSSHRMGIDVDLWLQSENGRNISNFNKSQRAHYSPELTSRLATTIRNNSILPVHKIWFADKNVENINKDNSHFNHMHVRFTMPQRYNLNEMKRKASIGKYEGSYA